MPRLNIGFWIGDFDSQTFYPSKPFLGVGQDVNQCIDRAWGLCSDGLAVGERVLGVSCMEKAPVEVLDSAEAVA